MLEIIVLVAAGGVVLATGMGTVDATAGAIAIALLVGGRLVLGVLGIGRSGPDVALLISDYQFLVAGLVIVAIPGAFIGGPAQLFLAVCVILAGLYIGRGRTEARSVRAHRFGNEQRPGPPG